MGEAPGRDEDTQGIQFCGKTGKRLENELKSLGINMRKDCWLHNAIICRPPNNETPTEDKIGYCRANVTRALKELQPEVIIPLGKIAIKSLLPPLTSEDVDSISKWTGWRIPSVKLNAWICPTFHPSYVERRESSITDKMFHDHLEAAFDKDERPWRVIPDYKAQVKCLSSPDQAADEIRKFLSSKHPVAFDYETNMLKPDSPQAEIVCCSLSNGEYTIAYPWHGEAVRATRAVLKDRRIKKIASNMKFEDRWTYAKLGFWVRGWDFDTMLGAHWLDQRARITSIKFQAFVHLGVPSWNDHIEPFLRSAKNSNVPNRIKEIDPLDLLRYNGLDSLFEFEVARIQKGLGFAT